MNSKRPVNLDLRTVRLPVSAYASILHRVSGVGLFVFTSFMLYALQQSLTSPDAFAAVQQWFLHPVSTFFIWLTLSALIYHFVAGIKHLLLDMDIADGKQSGQTASVITLIISFALIGLTGVWLW